MIRYETAEQLRTGNIELYDKVCRLFADKVSVEYVANATRLRRDVLQRIRADVLSR